MSVTRWPSGPTFHRMQQLSKPVLVTKGNFCFGFERCKGSIEKYNAVIRRVSDWSLIGQRPSGISRLCHIGDPKYSWEPEWHISGGLIIYLSRREMVFEVWDTFLRESRSMPGTPSGGIVKDLLTSPAGNVVIALYTDFKIYIWRNLTWKKLQGSIAHELRIFFVQDVAYLDRPTLNGLHLMMMDQRCRFLRYAQSHSKDQDPDEIRIGLFSDGTYVTRSQEQVPGGFASKYTIIANGAKQRAFYHYQAANYIWRTDSDAAIVLDTYIVTTGLGLVHFWSKAGKLVKSYRLGAKYEGCRGIALAGQHTVIAFDDRLTEATVWEFPRHDINDFASPTVPGRRYALE
ncbi:uncharacterized protein N7511_008481 [Penicillium nucicola]|uniref:uncharacterized protein n=1 Tax=Penicillium nucicola TaxID=1850975 RepID=UPI002544FFC7|nr:uncharacterized protein N7511_008481 [Penicillium nucicola]KAJ5751516.1 hypothetical protein N7511_008481 [Penicillium nucicola]